MHVVCTNIKYIYIYTYITPRRKKTVDYEFRVYIATKYVNFGKYITRVRISYKISNSGCSVKTNFPLESKR